MITAKTREPGIKAKALRKKGFVTGSVFGGEFTTSKDIQMDRKEVEKLLREKTVGSTVDIELDGKSVQALIKDVSRDPISREITNIGFQALESDIKVNNKAKIQLINREKTAGFIEQLLFELPYSALPSELFDAVVVDMSNVRVGESVTVGELDVAKNDKIKLAESLDTVVVTVREANKVVEEETTEEAKPAE